MIDREAIMRDPSWADEKLDRKFLTLKLRRLSPIGTQSNRSRQ